MRIAMFTETFLPNTDGIVTRLCATLRHLEEEGHEVLLFAPSGGPERYASAKIVGIPAVRFFLYPEKRFSMPWPRIGRALKAFKPDLIHAVNPAFLGLGAIYYAWKFKIPLVESYHTNVPAYARHYNLNWLEPALWWYFRTLHNRAVLNLCTSQATKKDLEAHGFKRVGLWERGVNYELFSAATRSAAVRERLVGKPISEDDRILLYVGRLAPEKGIERLRACVESIPGLHLSIVGDGPHRAELERFFTGTNTHFTGYLHGDELAGAYASADAFVFPSTTETLGLVLFEAMASGLPVVAADSEPTREVLEHGAAGMIFDATSQDSLVQSVDKLFRDSSLLSSIQEQGKRIAQSLDWKVPTNQLLRHYRNVTSEYVGIQSQEVSESRP